MCERYGTFTADITNVPSPSCDGTAVFGRAAARNFPNAGKANAAFHQSERHRLRRGKIEHYRRVRAIRRHAADHHLIACCPFLRCREMLTVDGEGGKPRRLRHDHIHLCGIGRALQLQRHATVLRRHLRRWRRKAHGARWRDIGFEECQWIRLLRLRAEFRSNAQALRQGRVGVGGPQRAIVDVILDIIKVQPQAARFRCRPVAAPQSQPQ